MFTAKILLTASVKIFPACAHVDISIIPVWLRRSLQSSNTDIRHLVVSPSVAASRTHSLFMVVHSCLPVVICRMYPYFGIIFAIIMVLFLLFSWGQFCSIASITTNTAQNSVCCGTQPAPIRDKSHFTQLY